MDVATPFATPVRGVSNPTGSGSFDWNTWLTALGVVLTLIVLWAGIKRIEISSPVKAFLSFFEVALLIIAVMSLRWVGAFLTAGISLFAILVYSFREYVQYDEILTDAAVQGNTDKEEIKALAKKLQSSGGAFKVFGPIQTARLIDYLSSRARKPAEIEHMAPAIATLWVIFRPELETFVGRFDRLMRLAREPPERAMKVADVLTAGTQNAAATFDEMLDGMLSFYDPSPE